MNAIGIDIGTTSICGILLDAASGKVLKSITQNSNAFIQTENQWEKIQDPQKILHTALSILEELAAEGAGAIGLTGQMHGIVYVDENGKAVSPLYTWQDARGSLPYDQTGTYAEFLHIPSGYGAVTDFFNTVNGVKPPQAAGYCTIQDYLGMVLTNRKTPLIHTSDAASFGGFDLIAGRFNHPFSSEITGDFALLGEYKGIPVSVAIGDNQASVFGASRQDSDILLNIGTGSQVSVISPEILPCPTAEIRPYVDHKFLIVGAALCGGRAYAMLERFYSDIVFAATGKRMDLYAVMEKMAVSGAAPLQVDTRFCGTRQDPSITGNIGHVTTDNFTPGDLRQAFLTGMITELYNLFTEMGVKRAGLIGSGNGLRKNKALVQTAEEIFGAKMSIPAHREEAAFGAALFAMTAAGTFGSAGDIKNMIQYEAI